MANIEQDLQAIMDARYGRDVRQSIHDAIKDINDQEEGHVEVIEGYTEDAEAWAKGTKGGTPVESTDPTYHNNAKYYAESIGDTALISEEYAKGTKNGTPVTSGEIGYHDNSKYYSEQAGTHAEDAEAWAVGQRAGVDVPSTDPTYENNAKYWQAQANYWYLQAKAIAEGFSGALRPMGTVSFANLPSLASATAGDMYNVSDEFTTTADFKEGAGHVIPLGSNVYKTTDDKWDVLAGSPVTGIKGNSESNYRRGNVNITKANIGLGNVDNESLGSADISTIGDGSVKGAIASLNNGLSDIGNLSDLIFGGQSIVEGINIVGNRTWFNELKPSNSVANVLQVNTNNPMANENVNCVIVSTTPGIPTGFAWGYREVYFISTDEVIIHLVGIKVDGTTIYNGYNCYNHGTWTGWTA